VALRSNGTVTAWGNAPGGPVAVTVPADLTGVIAIFAGTYHPLALKGDGTVAAWNWSLDGNGLTNVPPGFSDVVAVAAGYRQSLSGKSERQV
jgi:alpha-tubulin suppressor-like RCC1 family protein